MKLPKKTQKKNCRLILLLLRVFFGIEALIGRGSHTDDALEGRVEAGGRFESHLKADGTERKVAVFLIYEQLRGLLNAVVVEIGLEILVVCGVDYPGYILGV